MPAPVQAGHEAVVEYLTKIRGRDVSCRICEGKLTGDHELIAHLARPEFNRSNGDPVTVAHLVRDAVGSDVTVRFGESGGTLHLW